MSIRDKALAAWRRRQQIEEADRLVTQARWCEEATNALSQMLGIPKEDIAVERPDIPWLRIEDIILQPAWDTGRIHGFYLVINGEETCGYVYDLESLGQAIATAEERARHQQDQPQSEPDLCPLRGEPCWGVRCAWGLASGRCAIPEMGMS